ncbi:FHA domain-containing protein [Bailinhaonella thermotolerans]|uniref:FHA domain-containing protein n=1 Tax=Bailinhaonella thermotolerans TaxID=1070861 RepID=A0A3A4B196_9ACTN|nr:FHA domain-containing protein [Bailinhaonella thermotolerans]RJL31873.1 FHA domain-containing protein [Bailinhaonella thermotolerans]
METVIVQLEGGSASWELAPGERLTFGRAGECDVVLDEPAVSRRAGRLVAAGDHWLVTNLSARVTYVVENPEGGGEFIKIPPGRVDAPVPFEFGRLRVPGTAASLLVFAPCQAFLDAEIDSAGEPTMLAYPLDHTAKYFLVLVALCEPRLRDPATAVIPGTPQLQERLSRYGLSRKAIAFQIEYLATRKLRIKETGEGGKADWQRAALVATALRYDLVRAEHLDLLT